jgi:hypothetical protein
MIDEESDDGSWGREIEARPKTMGELRLELADLRAQANQLARDNEQLVLQAAKSSDLAREANQRHEQLLRALRSCGVDAESILRIATVIQGVKPEESR